MEEEFKAGLFAQPAFGRFVTILAALTVTLLVLLWRELAMVASGALLIAFVRLRARRMGFSEDTFRYDGWIRSVKIPIDAIVDVKPASSWGYPTDRWHGGQVCILTKDRRFWIRPIWFAPQAARALQERLGRQRRAPRKTIGPRGLSPL